MELRKQKEVEYYDKKVGDFKAFESSALASFQFLYKLLGNYCQGKVVLDYGCGNGIHAIEIAKLGAEKVIGIDLSEKSLGAARDRVKKEGLGDKVEFISMDCEKMEFPGNSFDVIFDAGTFSSIDLRTAYPELVRVLKQEGVLAGIETFGHNPLTNLKRKFNKITGKRTEWATSHIFKNRDLEEAKKYFSNIKVYYFHLISWLAFPFLKMTGGKLLLKLLEYIDKLLLRVPFLRKYAFKVVFIFSGPKK
jgi:ubiquinone/menaquinone biosynthesis C-methylase UbiE